MATQNPNLVPSAILLGASIVPLAFLAFVYGRRLPYRVPGAAVAVAAFLGGVIGTVVAATLEFDVARDLGGLPMLGVGLIEETSKLLVPLALLLVLRDYRTRADGLLIGVACGAGFAALETMGYAFTTLIKSGGEYHRHGRRAAAARVPEPGRAHGLDRHRRRRAVRRGRHRSAPGDPAVRRGVRRGRGAAHAVGQHELADRHCGRRGAQPRLPRLHRPPRRRRGAAPLDGRVRRSGVTGGTRGEHRQHRLQELHDHGGIEQPYRYPTDYSLQQVRDKHPGLPPDTRMVQSARPRGGPAGANCPASHSLLCRAYEARIPFTAHVTIGGDICHFHPEADGAAIGATTHTDFRLLGELVRRMNGGGVYLNIGSAVTLPEVFLKAVTLVRNLGNELTDITTANFDFIQSYRPLTNVVRRPTATEQVGAIQSPVIMN